MSSKSLNISSKDEVTVKDRIDTYKFWINRLKHFFTVKVLPPRQ